MKVLSVHPVWAWAIVHGHKPVENRTWRTNYRGPLAIHATKRPPRRIEEAARAALAALGIDVPEELSEQAILGTVELTGTPRLEDAPAAIRVHALAWGPRVWVLADARAFNTPLPCSGRQGLWTIDDAMLDGHDDQRMPKALASAGLAGPTY